MEIKRYDMFYDDWVRTWGYEEDEDGDWIQYEDINKIRAQAVREYFGKLAAMYEPYRFMHSYTAFEVARHINAQASYYANKIERGE